MPLHSLPDKCFINVLSFLDNKSLYKCLFVNRYYCKFTIPIIWRNPFNCLYTKSNRKLIKTLLAYLDEDEISSLIPYAIKFNNKSLLFEYGKFIRKINHNYCVRGIKTWLLLSSSNEEFVDYKVRKLISVIYHMIMRESSDLQEFVIEFWDYYIDLPKISIFTTYKPGITNLRTLIVNFDLHNRISDTGKQNTIEFLNMVPKFCNGIVNCELWISDFKSPFIKPTLDLIKFRSAFVKLSLDLIELQPLKRISVFDDKEVIRALEFRSENLKELSFKRIDFRGIDLSFMSKLKSLERLEFIQCSGFVSQYYYDTLLKKKFDLKEFKLCCEYDDHSERLNVIESMINSFCGETLLWLTLYISTPEMVKVVKESCPNIRSLNILICSGSPLVSIIQPICELSSLKILSIAVNDVDPNRSVEILGDYLTFVEYLLIDIPVYLPSFEYFIKNCKASLRKLVFYIDDSLPYWGDWRKLSLTYMSNYQRVHNSLKIFGINKSLGSNWTSEESEIINTLKNQGVDVISSYWLMEFGELRMSLTDFLGY